MGYRSPQSHLSWQRGCEICASPRISGASSSCHGAFLIAATASGRIFFHMSAASLSPLLTGSSTTSSVASDQLSSTSSSNSNNTLTANDFISLLIPDAAHEQHRFADADVADRATRIDRPDADDTAGDHASVVDRVGRQPDRQRDSGPGRPEQQCFGHCDRRASAESAGLPCAGQWGFSADGQRHADIAGAEFRQRHKLAHERFEQHE